MIHIYCGEGKGKTTAAIGLAVRSAGRGNKVYVARFLKDSDSGELESLSRLPTVTVAPSPEKMKFTFVMTDEEKAQCREQSRQMLETAFASGADLIVLDECCGAIATGMLDADLVSSYLSKYKDSTEIVLTGRDPDPKVEALADYITCMTKLRHPFDKGQGARRGVEF